MYIFADAVKGGNCGKSPGYGCCLVAESTNENVRISAEVMSMTKHKQVQTPNLITAEDLGKQAALELLEVNKPRAFFII